MRATRDLDLVADPDRENMGRLAAALTAMGGCHPIQDASTGENRARPASTKVRTDHGEVEVLNRMPGIPAFTELVRQRMMLEIQAGVAAPICSLAHLRAMKAAAGRPRDLVDLTELEALHGSG